MRYKTIGSKLNQERVVNKFLFIPLKIKHEVRWLEIAEIRQRCYLIEGKYIWLNAEFINK
jgi:hypothetical protein|tara:strand:+ start:333 stop:512 length:180 start_codon:yes stop_codon:yes gene_type:complete